MLFLAQNGFRVVAHDRRGHGRSSQASSGNDMNGYADDLAAVIEALDLKDATLVGHSTGGGESPRYIGRHGTKRVAKAVLVRRRAADHAEVRRQSGEACQWRCSTKPAEWVITKDRSQFYKDLSSNVLWRQQAGGRNSPRARWIQFWLWSMQAGLKNAYESIKAFSETDFTEDLKKFDVPTLVMHGGDNKIVPNQRLGGEVGASSSRAPSEVYYPGAPHGLTCRLIRIRSTQICSRS